MMRLSAVACEGQELREGHEGTHRALAAICWVSTCSAPRADVYAKIRVLRP